MHFRKDHKWKYVLLAAYVLFVLVFPVLIFTGYSQEKAESMIDRVVKEEDDEFFRGYIAQLQNGEIDQAYSQLHPEVLSAFSKEDVRKISKFIDGTSDDMYIVNAQFNTYKGSEGSRTTYDVMYEMANDHPEDKYILAQIQAVKEDGETHITRFQTYLAPESIKNQMKVNFASQWPVILLSIAIPLFIAFTALHYLSKAHDPRWLILIMILFLTLYLTVSSQKYGVSFGFHGFADAKGIWGPIVFNTPIPLGVLIYWVRRNKFLGKNRSNANVSVHEVHT